jgi:IS1 transposase
MNIPTRAMPVFTVFRPTVSTPTDHRFLVLVLGAVLTTGRRTVTNVLRTGRDQAPGHMSSSHRIFSQRRRSSYAEIFPATRHRAVGKETGRTNQIERFNNTMRQRISRLVRKTLSFSKKLANHVGAMWLFVHHDNASLGL